MHASYEESAATELTLRLADGEIQVYLDGPRYAPALLLIHGTAASARTWTPMVPLLAESHRVIRIDLLGCGRSAEPADASYTVPDQANRASAALSQLGVERAVVVGHSSGGVVAAAVAEHRPDLVSALALVNTGPRMAAYLGENAAIDPAQWPNLSDEQLRHIASSAFAPGYRIPQPFLDQVRAMNLRVFAATSQAVRDYLDEQALPERLRNLGKPLLAIFGAEDRRWNVASAAEYREVAGGTVELLPDLGHSPNLEDPARTAQVLLEFTRNQATTRR
ncbi:pimeloyl-ACP methyl ester carboxylesterase [Tamaricihabitans halophyticus]|uniref:Pimeloyl-ACP methyl ester carboxylesterase n=1 Tax=Tamaricihabitans halophyticus TaxID=1262583 RepID=A0A4R2R0I5_9PSEU|nr:alpha/beta hydrolase [Tamaricihabitans halophyticus]TCP56142.1 pimeloyl-ACP methyl ester carboxylesterase [Tamaricihabitans halophyticus]